MKTDIVVIVQCRLSSTRFPEKAIKDLGGKTVLEWTLSSMKKVQADKYFVATDEDSYPILKPIVEKAGWEIFKGPLTDVLKRFCLLIETLKVKYVLRATADNPFLFYEAAQSLCDEFVKQNKISPVDYMTYTGLPHGSGVEIFKAESLLQAEKLTTDPYEREHVGPGIYNHKNQFVSLFFKSPVRFYFPHLRTTIDTPQDYRKALSVVSFLSNMKAPLEPYTTEQIIKAMTDSSVNDTILFVPSVKKGQGTGHLRRALTCAKETGGFVYIPESCTLEEVSEILSEYFANGLFQYQVVNTFPEKNEYSVIVADCFNMEKEEIISLKKAAPVIAIDEGSSYTDEADYLIDIIPSLNLNRKANFTETSFIEKPDNKRLERPKEIKKVLICLGGEDPSSLTVPAAKAFAMSCESVTAILSESSSQTVESLSLLSEFSNLTFISPVHNLKEKLYEYDLVVTHYGLTAFESLSSGCAVLLLVTSKLHHELAKKYGFLCLSQKELVSEKIRYLIKKPENFFPKLFFNPENKSLSDFIKNLSHGKRLFCPVCLCDSETSDKIVSRTEKRTFRKCRKCGIIYVSFNTERESDYNKDYFNEQYKAQYGKTYLEDFENIKRISSRRINEISSISHSKSRRSILDVGCAYGPFLSCAAEKGWQVYGIDPCFDAVKYVQTKLLFPCVCGKFPDFDSVKEFGLSKFDAVSMWFVIEHFSDLKTVLTSVSSLLKDGGVFAFSTPSATGVSALKNTENFYIQSPLDHYTIWSGKTAKKILDSFGFKVVKIVSTGHHPERFPALKNSKENKIKYKIFEKISKIRKYGDTFEVYCKKVK